MKHVKDLLPKKSELDERVRGDALGMARDWRSLEALAEATRKRYEKDHSDAARQRYLKVIEAVLPLFGEKDAEGFRSRHHELVARLAPDSRVERALAEVPSLGPAPRLIELAKRFDLERYQAPEEDPERASPWVERDEPGKTSGAPRVPASAEAA